MAIDPYALCPCGSGKKLKFCCGDLAPDIEKIQRMTAGDQPHAALQHVVKLLEKHPNRASLVDLRANLELMLHDFDAARQTITHFHTAHPKNANAQGLQAILLAATESGSAALGTLQDALELLDDDMPQRVFEAIGAVGHALLLEGDIIAARGHLMLYAGIAPDRNNLALDLLVRMNLQANLPLLMREYQRLEEAPEDAPWKVEFEHGMRASGRGQWRAAEAIFASLRDKVGLEPAIVYNLALLRGWLGRTEEFADGLHEFARLQVPESEAVEAEALAQLLDPKLEDPQLETVRVAFAVTDEDALTERFVDDKRIESYPLQEMEFDEGVIRPRDTYLVLDKPVPAVIAELTTADIPQILGFLSFYGKRTDREAQLEFTTDRTPDFEASKSLLTQIAGEALGAQLLEEAVARKSLSEEALSWRWRLPTGIPPEQKRRLVASQRRVAILERWTAAPRAALQGKSPREAVGEPELRIPLLASAMIIEQACLDPEELPLFADLRQRLGLPSQESIDPSSVVLERLSIVRVPHLQLSKIPAAELTSLLNRSTLLGANLAILAVAAEIVSETRRGRPADLPTAFEQLIRLEPDIAQARQWVAKARAWAHEGNRSQAQWALMDLELSIQTGDSTAAQNALDELRTRHINEPGVAEATYRLLYAAGILSPQSGTQPTMLGMSADEQSAVSPSPGGSRLWTPEETASQQATPGGKKSAIWTPS